MVQEPNPSERDGRSLLAWSNYFSRPSNSNGAAYFLYIRAAKNLCQTRLPNLVIITPALVQSTGTSVRAQRIRKKNKTKQGRPTILSIHNPLAYRPIQGTAEIFSFIGLTDHVSFVHSLAHLKQFSIHGWPSSLGPASETTSLSDAQSWCFYPELCTLSPASLPTLLSELSWKFSQLPVRPHSPQEARAEQSEQLLWTPDRPQVHSSELSKYK